MALVQRSDEPVLLAVAARIFRSLFLFCVLVLILYLLGNYQGFLDSTQIMLLRVIRTSALAGSLLGFYSLSFRLYRALRRIGGSLTAILADAAILALDLVLLVGVELLFAWVQSPAA
jgi:hypothetical protein